MGGGWKPGAGVGGAACPHDKRCDPAGGTSCSEELLPSRGQTSRETSTHRGAMFEPRRQSSVSVHRTLEPCAVSTGACGLAMSDQKPGAT